MQFGKPLIYFREIAGGAGNVKCSVLFEDLAAADFAILPTSIGAEGIVRWLTPEDGGRPAPARVIYDELGARFRG